MLTGEDRIEADRMWRNDMLRSAFEMEHGFVRSDEQRYPLTYHGSFLFWAKDQIKLGR